MSTPSTVALHTLGCKLNFSETSSVRRQFEGQGYAVVPMEDPADIYVLNTCSVTDFADRKCRQWVRKVVRNNPDALVIVTGCYAQLKPVEIAEIPGVDLVLGSAEKFRILEYIDGLSKGTGKGSVEVGNLKELNSFHSSFSFGDRTRSFLKVQDGCDYKCSFCTIPKARGKSRSDTVENVLLNARNLAKQGIKEIVLTGVNLGDFGNGTEVIEGNRIKKEALFIDLIKALDEVEEIERFRISSIEPNLCTDEIIDFVARSSRFVPHFHMPLQSGNNRLLKLMRRRYKRELYEERVRLIKKKMPLACIGVDVISGFPGETDKDFKETIEFLEGLDISYLHAFTYSERPGTPAAEMVDVVDVGVRRHRTNRLRSLSQLKMNEFRKRNVNTSHQVLIEKQIDDHIYEGHTENYIKTRVHLPDSGVYRGSVLPVFLSEYSNMEYMVGQPHKIEI